MSASVCGEVSRRYSRGKLATFAAGIAFTGVMQGIIEKQNRRY